MKYCHKVSEYMSKYPWEWLSEERVCRGAKVSREELLNYMELYTGSNYIVECAIHDGVTEYRYVSNRCNSIHKAIVYLKSVYPEWKTGGQIAKAIGMSENMSLKLTHLVDVAPIEKKKAYVHRQLSVEFRYIPNDKRSLIEHEKAKPAGQVRVSAKASLIVSILQQHPGEYITANDIAGKLGDVTGRELSAILQHIRRWYSVDYIKPGPGNRHGLYCYVQQEAEA